MERLIVNEGQGGRPHDLFAAVTRVGSGPDCDIVLCGPAAAGCEFVIERTSSGHAVRVLSGDLYYNEQPCLAADLLHNDTLRAGDSFVLYKNPAATLPAVAPPQDLELLDELDELDDAEKLDDLEEPEELEELAAPEEPTRPATNGVVEPARAAVVQVSFDALRPEQLSENDEIVFELESDGQSAAEVVAAASSAPTLPTAPTEATAATETTGATVPTEASSPSAVTLASAPAAARVLGPDEVVRFRRPLPAGRRGPTFLPPAHPGRSPR